MTARILIVVGLIMALCAVAQAEPTRPPAGEQVLPVGTRVIVLLPPPRPACPSCTGGALDAEVVDEDMLIINVSTGRKGNEARRLARKLEEDLRTCARDAAIVKASPSPWLTAVKWTAVGLAIGGAFALGVMVGN